MLTLTPELYWLVLTLIFTGLLWVPYIIQLIIQQGPIMAIWDPTGAHPHDASWALRARKAHYNAIENMAVMAPLTILVAAMGIGDEVTTFAAALYFAVRVAHYVIYTFAIPVVRTVVFLIGFGCQMVFAGRLLGWW